MFSVPTGNRAADYDPRARGWYKAATGAQQTIVTEPYIAASSGKLVITVATPVQRQGQMIGVAGADIDLSSVSAIINSLNFGGHGHAFIVSADGKILIHPDSKLVLKTLADAYPNGAPKVSPGLKEVEIDGKPVHLLHPRQRRAFGRLVRGAGARPGHRVLDAQRIPHLGAHRHGDCRGDHHRPAGMLIRVLMQPLLAMGRAMHDIAEGEGDLTKRLTIHGHDEFGALGLSFNRFVERIHTSIREVSSATGQVNEVALRVVAASNSSMYNSDQQASRTSSVAAAINQLGAAAQEIAQNAALASQHSSDARSLAEDGQQVVDKTITRCSSCRRRSATRAATSRRSTATP
jgi:methyl-accepting chemotaxis protein